MKEQKERHILARGNAAKRVFTLRITYSDNTKSKYRTYPMSQEEYNECLHYTRLDWEAFLKREIYLKIV